MFMKAISRSTVFAIIIALALAAISAVSVFAAPASNTRNNASIRIWGIQFRELQTDRTLYSKSKAHPEEIKGPSKPAQNQQYLNQYAFALKQAEAIIGRGNPSSTSSVQVNNRYEKSLTAQQELAPYLHMISGLQVKLGVL